MSYEIVNKKEYGPIRKKIEEFILNIQKILKTKYTFNFVLIGSGKHRLITRKKDGNQGFDFDYNFELQKIKTKNNEPERIRTDFYNVIQSEAKKNNYKVDDRKKVITIKHVDQTNSKIVYSCDFAIIQNYSDDNNDEFQRIIVKNENSKNKPYVWGIKPIRNDYPQKLKALKDINKQWGKLLENEYLKLKNNNKDEDKRSYQLYIEAINNLYNIHVKK